jgi:hypothetical protein
MERTESIVVSISPQFENDKIAQMSNFGWNLQNRQEVVGHLREAEIPDNLMTAVGRGMKEGASGKKILEYDHYTKLHFVRSLSMPGLSQIKQLESEYFALPFPAAKGIVWPVLFTLMPIPALFGTLSDPLRNLGLVGFCILWMLLGVYWVTSRIRKRQAAASACAASAARAQRIEQELSQLLAA